LLKKIILVIFSLVSSLILTAIASAIYLAVQVIRGVWLTDGTHELQRISKNMNPYIPYLIIVPMVLGILALVIKKKSNPIFDGIEKKSWLVDELLD
jgi:ABC-type molybdate transport system permease subunit